MRIFQFLFVISEKFLSLDARHDQSASRTWNAMHNPWNRYRQSDSIHDRTEPRPSHAPVNTTPKKKGNRTFWGSVHLSLGGDTALAVGDLNTEGLGLLDDLNALAGGDGVGDPASWLAGMFWYIAGCAIADCDGNNHCHCHCFCYCYSWMTYSAA